MRINITTSQIKKVNFITKVTLILLGVFISSVILGTSIQLLETKGLWLGIILSLLCVAYGLYYCPKNSYRRIVSWGILGSLILGTILFVIGISLVSSGLEGF